MPAALRTVVACWPEAGDQVEKLWHCDCCGCDLHCCSDPSRKEASSAVLPGLRNGDGAEATKETTLQRHEAEY